MRVEKKRLTTMQQPNHSKNFRVRLSKIALKPDHSDQLNSPSTKPLLRL
jgi:hypothetical protein